jgi:tetratricopeptide (TPR) repeat protein
MFAVVLAGALRAGAQTPDPALEPGFEVLEEGRTTLNDKAVAAAQDYFRRLTEQHPEKAIYFYDLGRVNYYRCEAGSSRDDKKNVERALDEAIAEVEQSLKLNERAVDAHSLLADLYRRRITFGSGMIHGPNYGPRLKAGNKRAFELDAHDPRVCASPGKAVSQRAVWRGC